MKPRGAELAEQTRRGHDVAEGESHANLHDELDDVRGGAGSVVLHLRAVVIRGLGEFVWFKIILKHGILLFMTRLKPARLIFRPAYAGRLL
jgi:hypothetical protein